MQAAYQQGDAQVVSYVLLQPAWPLIKYRILQLQILCCNERLIIEATHQRQLQLQESLH
jgi:hypothetical protein